MVWISHTLDPLKKHYIGIYSGRAQNRLFQRLITFRKNKENYIDKAMGFIQAVFKYYDKKASVLDLLTNGVCILVALAGIE